MTKCGFCSTVGHNIRHCNSPRIQHIQTFIQTCATEESLLRYLYQCSAGALSIIMIFSYGASGVTSMNKQGKILYIRNKWRIDNHIAPPQPVFDLQQFCVDAAEQIYREVCIGDWNIATINDQSSEEIQDLIEPFMLNLVREIVNVSGNNYTVSLCIRDKLISLLGIEGELNNHIRVFFRRTLPIEHMRVAGIVVTPVARLQVPQQQVPHKPKFAQIQFCSTISDTINDFTCGICADDLSQETIPMLGCKHTLCSDCIIGQIKARTKSFISCPFCREEVKEIAVIDDTVRQNINTFITNEI